MLRDRRGLRFFEGSEYTDYLLHAFILAFGQVPLEGVVPRNAEAGQGRDLVVTALSDERLGEEGIGGGEHVGVELA